MSKNYLCANHRQQLQNYPKQALKAWSKCYEAGQSLIAMGFDYDALAHLGCAYEAAEIVLSSNYYDTFDATTILTSSAATLAKQLAAFGQTQESANVIELTSNRIEQECVKNPELSGLLRNQLLSLKYFVGHASNDEFPLEEEHLSFYSKTNRRRPGALH